MIREKRKGELKINENKYLMSLKERLYNPKVSKVEQVQREVFMRVVKSIDFLEDSKQVIALSISTGDGMWDYLVFINNNKIKKIIATDIVDNPVNSQGMSFLKSCGEWEFVKVEPEAKLPFEDEIFNLVFHQDVVEHVEKPSLFLAEQYRVLKKKGVLLFGTPNLLRPVNILKLLLGKLYFPIKIGYNQEIRDYIHVQEFYEQQMKILLKEVGFKDITVFHSFFGIHFLNLAFSFYPKSNFGKTMAHYLTFMAKK